MKLLSERLAELKTFFVEAVQRFVDIALAAKEGK